MNRRDFGKLATAALGGLVAGAGLVNAAEEVKKKDATKGSLLLQEPHICRGLNTCKGTGSDKKNDCAGMGTCASAKAHTCKTQNDCAGLGGCGETPGENTCKGKGDCAVPLEAKAWPKARANFEKAMTAAKKKFGDAPKAATPKG